MLPSCQHQLQPRRCYRHSCILRLDWSQLPATIIQPHLQRKHTSYRHCPSSWRPNTMTTSVISAILVVFVILPLCPFHCLWLSLLARIKLKSICGVDSLIGSATLSPPLWSLDGFIWLVAGSPPNRYAIVHTFVEIEFECLHVSMWLSCCLILVFFNIIL